ncbi:GNAT family N-acetyltransferase [Baaleninema sp.]|uniref:GNAT family N-acetyltransferase n=1 Tax=Baaleninema sp. TaxID=3101197 RepID=UPI003CFE8131
MTLPTTWTTERLYIADTVADDLVELQQIYEECNYIAHWSGYADEPTAGAIEHLFRQGDLPPGGKRENYRLQTVKTQADDRTIAWLDLYFGYPTPEIVWIGTLEVRPDCQGRGYGREIERGLASRCDRRRYDALRLKVALKNWPALRFWLRCGYDRVLQYLGDGILAADHYAFLELEKTLKT